MHASDRLVRKDFDSSQRCFIFNLNIVACAGDVSHAHPASDSILAAYNAVRDEREAINCSSVEDRRVSDASAWANLTPGTDDNVWS